MAKTSPLTGAFCFTMGLIIPAEQLKAQSSKMLAESEKNESRTQAGQSASE